MLLPTFTTMQKIIHILIIGNRSTLLFFFMDYLKTKWLLLKPYFGLSKLNLITIMVTLMGMNLYGKSKTSEMVKVMCGIKNIHFFVPEFLVLLHVESHKRLLELVQQRVLGVTQIKLNMGKDLLLAVMYQRNKVFFYTSACI